MSDLSRGDDQGSVPLSLTRADLLAAFLDARRYARAHPDLSDHYGRRYSAMAAALGVELGEEPGDGPAKAPAWFDPEQFAHLCEGLSNGWLSARRELHGLFIKTVERLESLGVLRDADAVWSMWLGYLTSPSSRPLSRILRRNGVAIHLAHASGHACRRDLRRLVDALGPQRVVPIHTAFPEAMASVIGAAELRADGEWWMV